MRLFVVLTLAILVCGCLCNPDKKATSVTEEPSQGMDDIASDVQEDALKEPDGSLLADPNDLHAYLTSGGQYFCNFSDGPRRVEIWLFDGRYFAILRERQRPANRVVNDGVWEYNWFDGQKNAIKYKNSEIRGLTSEATKGEVESNKTKFVLKDIDDVARHSPSLNCTLAEIEEGLFIPPKLMQFRVTRAKLVDIDN